MKKNYLSRRQFLKLGGMSFITSAMSMNFGTRIFAAPSNILFDPVRFAVISDIHLDINGKNGMKMSGVSTECLVRTVADINQEKDLSFVLVAGDLLLDGELENACIVKKSLDKLLMPYYVIAGNHDYIPANPQNRRKEFNYLTMEDFVKFFNGHGYDSSGKRYYAHQITPGLRLIGLDACLPLDPEKWGGVLVEQQLQWLDKQLRDHADELNLVYMHHNFVRWSKDELIGGPKQWFCIDNDVKVRAVLSKHSKAVPVVISGHRHTGLNFTQLNGVNYFIVPSLNSHPMRYCVFNISNESVSWKTPMVSVSESIHLKARQNLLNAQWWRQTQFKEINPDNDLAVLKFYENNPMAFGYLSWD
ncbi:MAG: Tat pathway signal protein [Desulfobacteraceae bacterium]|nr:Tat pathway signal protein [Desulfobacteraceae bacterium]